VQAEYVAEIRLRNINREFILKRVAEVEDLEKEIADLEDTLHSRRRVRSILIEELRAVMKKYPQPRRSGIVYSDEEEALPEEELPEDYPVTVFVSRGGYLKKITPQSLRMNDQQKYKEEDGLRRSFEATNRSELLVFTDRQQCYKARLSDFDDTKASALGAYLPTVLGMDEGESVVEVIDPGDYSGQILLMYENGKVGRVELESYATRTNRRRLTGASCDKSPLVTVLKLEGEQEIALYTSEDRCLVFSTALLQVKSSRATQGVAVARMKPKYRVTRAMRVEESGLKNLSRYRVRSLPALGALLKDEDTGNEQLSLLEEETT